MFQPKSLKCFAAQKIINMEICINIGDIPQNLWDDITILVELKTLMEEETYLKLKLCAIQTNKEEAQIEYDRLDVLAQEAMPDLDLLYKFLADRDFYRRRILTMEMWEEITQTQIRYVVREEKSLNIPEAYHNIKFNQDHIEYDIEFDMEIWRFY